jgi:hypothetical protein
MVRRLVDTPKRKTVKVSTFIQSKTPRQGAREVLQIREIQWDLYMCMKCTTPQGMDKGSVYYSKV